MEKLNEAEMLLTNRINQLQVQSSELRKGLMELAEHFPAHSRDIARNVTYANTIEDALSVLDDQVIKEYRAATEFIHLTKEEIKAERDKAREAQNDQ